jgi:hypothetical protein
LPKKLTVRGPGVQSSNLIQRERSHDLDYIAINPVLSELLNISLICALPDKNPKELSGYSSRSAL